MLIKLKEKGSQVEFDRFSRKEQTMRIFLSDEKLFDIDGVYNVQNDRIWDPSRAEANKNGRVMSRRKFL